MSDTIRVIIVDDLPETRENVRKLLQFEQDMDVIGQAGTGEEAIELAQAHQPDIILMDINMPGVDGIGASQKISELVPHAQIIIMSVQSDSNYLRRAMMAGARDFLTKPFGGDELVAAVRRVHAKRPAVTAVAPSTQTAATGPTASTLAMPSSEGSIIAVFSPKGGTGCSTVAINTAVSLARQNHRTILVDGSLQFGDVAVMLNLKPMTSIVDVSTRSNELDQDLISSVVQLHSSELNVLMSPPRPEMADMVTDEHIKNLLIILRQMYDFIIIDTSSSLNDIALTILDLADRIILIAEQTLPSLKNVSRFLNLTESLEYEPDKIWLTVNRASDRQGISIKSIGDTLKRPVIISIPEDEPRVRTAANQGVPLVTGANRKQAVSAALIKLGDHIVGELQKEPAIGKQDEAPNSSGILGRLLRKRT